MFVVAAACSSSTSGVDAVSGTDPVDPAWAHVQGDVTWDGFPAPVLIVPLIVPSEEPGTWSHQILLAGAQGEWRPAIALDGDVYETSADGTLTPVSGEPDTPSIGYAEPLDIAVRVSDPGGLPVGRHRFELIIPVWLDARSAPTTDPDGEVVLTVIYDVRDPADDGAQIFESGGLQCYRDAMESGTYDYAEGEGGAPTLIEAIDRWWTTDDGRFRDDRDRLEQIIDGRTVSYADDVGNVQLILRFEEAVSGWRVSELDACADAGP